YGTSAFSTNETWRNDDAASLRAEYKINITDRLKKIRTDHFSVGAFRLYALPLMCKYVPSAPVTNMISSGSCEPAGRIKKCFVRAKSRGINSSSSFKNSFPPFSTISNVCHG